MAEQEDISLRLTIDGAEKELRTINELRAAVDQLDDQLQNAEFGSDAFKKAEAELKKANAQLFQFDKQLEGLQDPVKGAEQWVKFGEGVAGAFAAAQGAALLFGVENENIEKLVAKAQGATAIAVGARALAESQLITILKNSTAGKYAAIVADKAYSVAVGASTGALKIFRLALVATGLGAVAVAVGLLIANWDKFSEAIKKSITQITAAIPGLDKIKSAYESIRGAIVKVAEQFNLLPTEQEKALKKAEEDRKAFDEKAKEDAEKKKQEEEQAAKERRAKQEQEAKEREAQQERELDEAMDLAWELDALFDEMVSNLNARQEQAKPIELVKAISVDPVLSEIDKVIQKRKELGEIEAQIVENGKKLAEDSKAIDEGIAKNLELQLSSRVALIQASFGAINTILGAADQNSKKTQKAQKFFALATIAYDAGMAIANVVAGASAAALAATAAAPFLVGPYIAQGLAVVLPAIASAYAALKKAPDGGGGGAGSAPTAPTLPSFAAPSTEQRNASSTTAEGEFGAGVFKAYVIGSQVSSDLEARQRIEDLASLGG
jgi:hypothetical protein